MINSQQQNTHTQIEQSAFSESLLQKIQKDHVTQTPRLFFIVTEYGMWALWLLSVFIGAVAFSIMIFFFMYAPVALYEITHEGFFDFFLYIMPYAWVIVFVCTALLAHFNLRHTKRGYRYEVWQILISSLVASFLGGVVLHVLGVSFLVDSFVAKRMPLFPALQTMETRMWQSPTQGRMMGIYGGEIDDVMSSSSFVHMEDHTGVVWKVDTRELTSHEVDLLTSGKQVRIVGVPSTTAEFVFIGCGVLSSEWQSKKSLDDVREEHKRFIERIHEHQVLVRDMYTGSTTLHMLPHLYCPENPAVLRINKNFVR
jgi:hypothetical protein